MISTLDCVVKISGAVVPVTEGRIVLDAGRVPYVSARVSIPARFLELIDPRQTLRATITANGRLFDLGVRSRPVRLADGELELRLASDEQLLDDYRPLVDDPTPLTLAGSLNAVVSYVLATAGVGGLSTSGDVDVTPSPGGAEEAALIWQAGRSAMQFLHPLVQSRGLRLVCDETRTWSLRSASYTGHGDTHHIQYGVDIIDASETIDRDADLWFDARITRYRWTDDAGVQQERVDAFALSAPYSKATLLEVDAAYPGPGRSEYAVRRAQSRGREITVTTVANWTLHAEAPVVLVLPDTPTQFGAIQRLEYDLELNRMTITARTIDTPATSWSLLDVGHAWEDSPVGASWIGEAA